MQRGECRKEEVKRKVWKIKKKKGGKDEDREGVDVEDDNPPDLFILFDGIRIEMSIALIVIITIIVNMFII